MNSRILLSLLTLLLFNSYGYTQGCSDAGFCTVDGLKPHDDMHENGPASLLKLGAFYGLADNSITVYGNYLEYGYRLNSKLGFSAKLTSLGQSGNEITTFGLSDIYLTGNYQASDKFSLTLGAKLPLMAGDRSLNDLPLPMDYQSSLGTFDLIIGLGYEWGKLQLAAALQQPLTQNNNQFLASAYPEDSELASILSTRNFDRAGDALLRLSYPLEINSKLKFSPSALAIYHLRKDRFTNELDQVIDIENSQGLTLNANLYFDYKLSAVSSLQFNAGFPFIVRPNRPDGLTRSFIGNVEYRVNF